MQGSKHTLRTIGMLAIMILFSIQAAFGQEGNEQKKVRIQIEKTENGKTSRIDTTIIVDQNADVDGLLRELEVENHMLDMGSLDEDDDEMEVIIRKRGMPNFNMNIDVDVLNEKHKDLMQKVDSLLEISLKNISTGQGFLGVYFENQSSPEEDPEPAQGVRVTKVIEGTAAQKAGLKEGDIITKVDEHPIEITDDLYHTIQGYEPGTIVKVHYIREGKEETVDATLGKRNYTINIPALPGLNLDVPSRYYIFDEEEDAGISDKPFLGVYINSSSGDEDEGISVRDVIEGSTAEEIGLEKGDVILKINGENVNSLDELRTELQKMEVGDEVKVKYLRDGKEQKTKGEIKGRQVTHRYRVPMKFYNQHFAPGAPCIPMPPGAPNVKEYKIIIKKEKISDEEAQRLAPEAPHTFSGENTLALDNFSFSPNPNSGRFNVSFTLPQEGDTEIRIFDGTGKQIYTQMLDGFSGTFTQQLDISENPQGIYYLQVMQNNKSFNQKILIQ